MLLVVWFDDSHVSAAFAFKLFAIVVHFVNGYFGDGALDAGEATNVFDARKIGL